MYLVLPACLYFILTSKASSHMYCVSENGSCDPSLHCVQCQPLMQFVNQTILNDSTIVFLHGKHSLNSSENTVARVNFLNKSNLTLVGLGSKKEPSTVVCRGGQSGFLFRYSTNITVRNLSLQGCGTKMPYSLYGGVFFIQSYDITLSQVSIKKGKGFGLDINNCCGNIAIEDSHFIGNENGNVVVWLKHCAESELTHTHIRINNSSLQDGFTQAERCYATGLFFRILRKGVDISLTILNVTNNTGQIGGNIGIQLVNFAQYTSHVTIENCHITGGHARDSGGGGLNLKIEKNFKGDSEGFKNYTQYRAVLTVTNTTFARNKGDISGGGVWITYYERLGISSTIRQTEFKNCNFFENIAPRGGAIQVSKHRVSKHQIHNVPQFSVALTDCVISDNHLTNKTDQRNEDGIVELFSLDDFVITNSSFTNNKGTALMMVNSGVRFFNETVFENNSAQYGGALKLCESSIMYFDKHTRVKFRNNSARYAGGAIHAGNQCLQEAPPCFFQLSLKKSSRPPAIKELPNGILYFDGNQAGIAGHTIYGGSVDNCFTETPLRVSRKDHEENFYHSLQLYRQIFEFSNSSKSEVSHVTSDPYGVCLCDKVTSQILYNCTNRTITLQGYAGQNISLYVSAVGQMNGSIPSHLSIESGGNVKRKNEYASSLPFCQEVVVAVYPEKDEENVDFKIGIFQTNAASENSNYYRFPKLKVNVTVKDCPFPFKLNAKNTCDCPEPLREHYATRCDINTETIKRPSDSLEWVGYLHNRTVFAASKKCKKDRCKQGGSPMNIHNLSEVCMEGREGRICGKCKPDYSLSLGPLNCVSTEYNCSAWKFLMLLLVFFIAGILLVSFLAIFNLTVTEGTINGLLFYANCIHANRDSVFGTSHGRFNVFISWLNLDFGFSICFYSGMTAYQKFWLELGFLFYLLLLGVLIVCLSRRSIWFTRVTSRNMVPVLSTLLLIAYPKLVGTSIKVWKCRNKKYWSSDNSTPWIWHSDETIDCFAWKHLILFIVSILLFAVAFLYTLCLLFIQCLQRGSGWCVLRWVNKLRPFFEANTGPCRDHYRFWPGFLLFARLGLYIAFWPITDSRQRSYVLFGLCIFIFFLACVSPNGVYKKWPLNLLEFSFFLNLCITAGAVAEKHPFNYAFGYTSMSIAAFTFLLILIYHTYKRLRENRKWKRMVTKIPQAKFISRIAQEVEGSLSENSPLISPDQRKPLSIQCNGPREPLLEDN